MSRRRTLTSAGALTMFCQGMKLWRHVSLDHVTFDEKSETDASVVVSIVSHIPAPFFMSMVQRRMMLVSPR